MTVDISVSGIEHIGTIRSVWIWRREGGMVDISTGTEVRSLSADDATALIDMIRLAMSSTADPAGSAPYQPHSATSRAAAREIESVAPTQRRTVYRWLATHGPATDEEMQLGLGMSASSQRPRRIELGSMGMVADSGHNARTLAGRWAVRWRAVPHVDAP